MQKLHSNYTTSAALRLLETRYGLNNYAVRQILRIKLKRFRELLSGKDIFSRREQILLVLAFPELKHKIEYYEKETK